MHIGIDARQLSGPMVGTRRALESVLEEWANHGLNGHKVFLYAPREFRLGFPHPFHSRIGSRVGRLIGGTFWLQTELPMMTRRDALDVFWATTDILSLPLARKIPTLLTVQDVGYYKIPRLLTPYVLGVYRLFFSTSLRVASRILCTTSAVKHDLASLGLPEGKISIIPHGVDLARFSRPPEHRDDIVRKHEIASEFFLFVGHLRPNKNLERTLLAYKAFLSTLEPGRRPLLVMVGGRTNTDSSILRLIKEAPLDRYVRYLGYVPSNDLLALYHAALAFVSPSLYEGFGLPYLEAMAAGLPVMAPEIPTVSEICSDAAVYVDPLSIDSISAGFATLYRRRVAVDVLRQNSLARVRHFTWAHAAQRTLALLESLG